jgi:hypothetical protein
MATARERRAAILVNCMIELVVNSVEEVLRAVRRTLRGRE